MKGLKRRHEGMDCFEIGLVDASDKDLKGISDELGIGLSLDEMKMVKKYFKKEGRNPTDVELQAMGQAWSEHCSYKSSKKILKKFVFGIPAPQNISIISEDAGVVEFDDEHAYVVAMESHNHPAAVEPYGAAATGVGGILRDVVCMGAQPIGVLDPLFFAPVNFSGKLPAGTRHPKFLYSGVIGGVRDYGNQVGIPNLGGMVYFDDSYLTNPLVNVACIGFMKKDELIHSYAGGAGDIYVILGGRTGRDGIHGVTFASGEIKDDSLESGRSAVQVGQPIIKEPLIHVCLEANRKGILTGMKDLGGGGLSCVIGEMAQPAGFGAHIDLERVPLKEAGMAPWEIWVSESQERMMVTMKREKLPLLLELCNVWDIEAAVIGEVTDTKRLVIDYCGLRVFDMDIDFVVDAPLYDMPFSLPVIDESEPSVDEPADYKNVLSGLLSALNIASREDIVRVYDHEIMAKTVLKPLCGELNRTTHGDACVFKPVAESFKGLAVTCDVNPKFSGANPYWGAASALDEACRNLASVGARAHSFADCLNFGNPNKKERLGELYESARGLGDIARAIAVPFVSGNVSLYNEGSEGPILPTPAIFAVGIVDDVRNICTSELKEKDSRLYLVGDTKQELGGSEYYRHLKVSGGVVPRVDGGALLRTCDAIVFAIETGVVNACHDVSSGGIGVAVAEMSFGSRTLGARIDLTHVSSGIRSDFKMFSESNTRFIVEVKDIGSFEEIMNSKNVPFCEIGRVTGDARITFNDTGRQLVDAPVKELLDPWEKGLRSA